MVRCLLLVCSVVVLVCSGCTYRGYHTFSLSRQLGDSDLHPAAKGLFASFVAVPDLVFCPVAINIDGVNKRTADEGLSFHGQRTFVAAHMHPGYSIVGGPLILAMDVVLFPLAGPADVIHTLLAEGAAADDDEYSTVSGRDTR